MASNRRKYFRRTRKTRMRDLKYSPTGILSFFTAMAAMAVYYSVPIDWFMVFASFIASFIVSLVSMNGWERVAELWNRMIKKS